MENYYRIPILVSLERVPEGASSNQLKMAIVDALMVHGGLGMEELVKKFVSFGVDGASIFHVHF